MSQVDCKRSWLAAGAHLDCGRVAALHREADECGAAGRLVRTRTDREGSAPLQAEVRVARVARRVHQPVLAERVHSV